jgi:glycyl-tRNA synthetase
MSKASSNETRPEAKVPHELMATLVALCKRRGFIYPASEIYGGINGFFDYGPLGAELKRNIKEAWWQDMVQRRDDIVGIDSAIIQHPKVWESSGHVSGFSDPMVDCKVSKMRYRADQLFFGQVKVDGEVLGYVSVIEDAEMQRMADEAALKMKKKLAKQGALEPVELKPYTEAKPEEYALIPSPATNEPGSLTAPRAFNLMFQTQVGAMTDASGIAYLRPETAQGIFVNFKNVVDSSRVKIPFGIAQIGKAFRNEITPRNFIFRSREFEQMEMEYFIPPDEDIWPKAHREWIEWCKNWLVSIGLREDLIGEHIHDKDDLAHYSKACTDLTFHFPFGEQELWGIAVRGNFDLSAHQKGSGKSLEYFDEARKEKYLPHVIEPAVGVDRIFLALLVSAYCEDEMDGEKRVVMKFHPRMAPIKVAVLPLVKNKAELVEIAENLYKKLQKKYHCFYDASGAIGRRYRRMDEVGTPFCVTVDFDTLEKDQKVTLRERDSGQQTRLSLDELHKVLDERILGA